MSTKTMRLPPRRVLTPNVIDKKRKEREGLGFGTLQPSSKPSTLKPAGCVDPIPSNLLLAGYLAHEFLTRGTLLGRAWDPAKQEVVPVSGRGQKQRKDGEAEPSGGVVKQRRGQRQVEDDQRYVELANLIKTTGVHVPGIVNPTQLACFLQLQL